MKLLITLITTMIISSGYSQPRITETREIKNFRIENEFIIKFAGNNLVLETYIAPYAGHAGYYQRDFFQIKNSCAKKTILVNRRIEGVAFWCKKENSLYLKRLHDYKSSYDIAWEFNFTQMEATSYISNFVDSYEITHL